MKRVVFLIILFGLSFASAGECNDGIDNDGDGLVDWEYDLGCYNDQDLTEGGLNNELENGWTVFEPHSTTRIIYVSSSTGSDSYDGLAPEWNGTSGPKQSFTSAVSMLRDNLPDWILFKRGDSWTIDNFHSRNNGLSRDYPTLFGSYGSSTQRPLIKTNTNGLGFSGSSINYWALLGLELESVNLDGFGITIVMDVGEGWTIEDCKIKGYHSNLIIQTYDSGIFSITGINYVKVRRNILVDAAAMSQGHSQGMYTYRLTNFTYEDNIVDHNGWNQDADDNLLGHPTIFNHNTYTSNNNNFYVRNNIFSRGSSFGFTASPIKNAKIENNLFLANGNTMTYGVPPTANPQEYNMNLTIRDNVITRIGRKIMGTDQSYGIEVSSTIGLLIENNYFVHKDFGGTTFGIRPTNNHTDLIIRDNKMYDWKGVTQIVDLNQLTESKNVLTEKNVINLGAGTYKDSSRSVESYAASLGLQRTYEAFLTEARKQSKYNWRPEYTASGVNDYIREGFEINTLSSPECNNSVDDDGDGKVDMNDLGCIYTKGNREAIGNQKIPLGINFNFHRSYGTQIFFVDAMKRVREWATSNAYRVSGGVNEHNTQLRDEVPADLDGYPLSLPYNKSGLEAPQKFFTVTLDNIYGEYPGGIYTVFYEGEGLMEFRRDAEVISETQGMILLNVTPTNAGIEIRLLESKLGDHLRNIRIIMPGFENNYSTQIFYPPFLQKIKGFSTLRHMNPMQTNSVGGPTMGRWENRTTKTSYTQSRAEGIALEHIIEMSNMLGTNPWLTFHHLTEDTFIREYAKMLKQDLDPSLDVYVEYSNELWNGAFTQASWNWQEGCNNPITRVDHAVGNDWGIPGCDDGESGRRHQILKSANIFSIFEEEFGTEKNRVKKVLGSHSANPWSGGEILRAYNQTRGTQINPNSVDADYIAIAPYFGGSVANTIGDNNEVDTITIDEILDRAEAEIDNFVRIKTRENKLYTDQYGVELITYEGGQHLAAGGVHQNDVNLTNKLIAANRDPRMKDLYEQMFKAWYEESQGLFMSYNFIGKPGKFGSWGILEYLERPLSESPKYEAHLQAMKELGSNFVLIPYTPTPQPTTPICGDSICNSGETCSSCETDCGVCTNTDDDGSGSGGSSGGGGSTATLKTPTSPQTNPLTGRQKFFLRNKIYKFETKNRFIKRINLKMAKDADFGSIELVERESPSISVLRGKTLQTFEINPTQGLASESVIDSGEIIFSVPEHWVNENYIDKDEGVKLGRLSSEWIYYDSEFISQEDSELTYKASVPGFSEFVIIGLTKRELLVGEKNQKIISLAGLSIALIIVGSGIAIIIIFLQIDAVRRRKKKAMEGVRKSQELVRSYVGKIGE